MATAHEAAGNGKHDEGSPLGGAMSDAIDSMASAIGDPAEWPEMAEDFARAGYKDMYKELAKSGWWPAVYAAGGSAATLLGAIVVARRKAKRSGLMAAAMPMMAAARPIMAAMESQIADASEQMMRKHTKSGSGWMRTAMTLGFVALTGWGFRRAMAQAS